MCVSVDAVVVDVVSCPVLLFFALSVFRPTRLGLVTSLGGNKKKVLSLSFSLSPNAISHVSGWAFIAQRLALHERRRHKAGE